MNSRLHQNQNTSKTLCLDPSFLETFFCSNYLVFIKVTLHRQKASKSFMCTREQWQNISPLVPGFSSSNSTNIFWSVKPPTKNSKLFLSTRSPCMVNHLVEKSGQRNDSLQLGSPS